MDSFSLLPTELRLLVLSMLDWRSLVVASIVCKDWKTLSSDKQIWEQFYEKVFNRASAKVMLKTTDDLTAKERFIVHVRTFRNLAFDPVVSSSYLDFKKNDKEVRLKQHTGPQLALIRRFSDNIHRIQFVLTASGNAVSCIGMIPFSTVERCKPNLAQDLWLSTPYCSGGAGTSYNYAGGEAVFRYYEGRVFVDMELVAGRLTLVRMDIAGDQTPVIISGFPASSYFAVAVCRGESFGLHVPNVF